MIAAILVAPLVAGDLLALPIVSIGNGPSAGDGSYLNATNIAHTLAFTNVAVVATTRVEVLDSIDLSASPVFGPTFYQLGLQAPTVNINNNMDMGSAATVGLSTAVTANLTGKITAGASLLPPARFFSKATLTQVNVLANSASVQQAVDMSSTSSPVNVAITTGQYNETVAVDRSMTFTTAAPGGHSNLGALRVTGASATLTITGAGFSNAPGATLGGIGILNFGGLGGGGFINHGVVAPGMSAGTLSFTGNYNQASDGDLQIEIGGTTVGTQYDRLAVSGSATLAGTLQASLISGFVPSPSDTFTILTAASRSGTFSNAPSILNVPGSGYFNVSYTPSAVVLSNFQVPEPTGIIAIGVLGAAWIGSRRRAQSVHAAR